MTPDAMRARAAEWRRRAQTAATEDAKTKMNLLATHYEALAAQLDQVTRPSPPKA